MENEWKNARNSLKNVVEEEMQLAVSRPRPPVNTREIQKREVAKGGNTAGKASKRMNKAEIDGFSDFQRDI